MNVFAEKHEIARDQCVACNPWNPTLFCAIVR